MYSFCLLALVMSARVIQPKNNLTERIYHDRNANPNKKFCPAVHVLCSPFALLFLSFDDLNIADYIKIARWNIVQKIHYLIVHYD